MPLILYFRSPTPNNASDEALVGIRRIAGDQPLGHAADAHRAVLIRIAEKPQLRYILKAAGKDTVLVIPACCNSVIQGVYPYMLHPIPVHNIAFAAAAACASGMSEAFRAKGKKTNVIVYAGDGGTADIGIQALSGQYTTAWGPIGAALVLATFPTLIVYIFLSNRVCPTRENKAWSSSGIRSRIQSHIYEVISQKKK